MAGGPYQGHACRVPHYVLRGHRARNFCRSSPTLRKPSQISPSLSLLLSPLPLSRCYSFPVRFSPPSWLQSSTNAATLSHSPRPTRLRSPERLSFLLFFHSSVERLSRSPFPFSRRSWFVSVHGPLPSPSVRRRENVRIER